MHTTSAAAISRDRATTSPTYDRAVARAWWLGLFVSSLLAAPTARARTVFHLPANTRPTHVALAPDGSVWMTDEFGDVTRLAADGHAKDVLRGDNFADDLVLGPDRAMWVDNDTELDRFDAAGDVTRMRVSKYDTVNAITATSDAVWLANSGSGDRDRPRLERIDATGSRRVFADPVPRSWVMFNGLAAGPDGSMWFTQSRDRRSGGIGRMTPNGHVANWWLRAGDPQRIVAGSDGAMWFTEGHAFGRITSSGAISRIALPAHLGAADLVAGPDGALWFVSDLCVGRMTTGGALSIWPVAGALGLDGLAAAPDGTLWLADRLGNTIRRFDPNATPSAPCGAPALTRRSGATRATLAYSRDDRISGIDYFSDIQIRVARHGRELVNQAVPELQGSGARGDSTSLTVRDLDGDGEPEVTLLLNWGGTHCCSWSRVYRYDRSRHRDVARNHFWGNAGADPRLRDLDGDRRPEFISRDDRFTEVFTAYAGSVTPIRIWSYRRGHFHDVTRRYPGQVRRDAAYLWRLYRKYRRHDDARGILPAWAADEYLLGRPAAADQALENARARGQLKAGEFETPRDPRAYIRAVKALLRRTGYA
jgi:streptogramin lyase